MTLTILAYCFLAALAEVVGGALVLARKQWPARVQEYLLALSAGFLLSLVFVELVPEALKGESSLAPLLMLTGYAVLHFFEHTVVGHLHFGEETHHEVMVSRVASVSTFLGLFVHAFFDGFTIAIGMQFDFVIGILVFFAVLLHKVPEGLTVASVMLSARSKRSTAMVASVAIGVATLIGSIAALAIGGGSQQLMAGAFAFSAGVATYVGASDLIPEINHSRNRVIPLLVFAGMVLFYVGKRLLEG